jgi:DNA polymerase-3 subunit beta
MKKVFMKVTLSSRSLSDAVSKLQAVLPSRSPKPELSHLRLKGHRGKYTLEATDLEVSARLDLGSGAEQELDLLLPSDPFGGIVRETPEETLELRREGAVCVVSSGGARYRLPCREGQEFPRMELSEPAARFSLPVADWKKLLERTQFACAREKTRYALNGVRLQLEKGGKLEAAATDGRRLAVFSTQAKGSKGKGEWILPLRTTGCLDRIWGGESEGEVELACGEGGVEFGWKGGCLTSRLLEGSFPDYRAVIPSKTKNEIRVDRQSLALAVRQAALVSPSAFRSVVWECSKDGVLVSASSSERGEASILVKGEYRGEKVSVRFNPDYLLDPLRVFQEKMVRVGLEDGDGKALFHLGADYLYVLLPLRLVGK